MPGTGTSLAGNFILKSELAELPVEQFNMFVIRGHIKTPANIFLFTRKRPVSIAA